MPRARSNPRQRLATERAILDLAQRHPDWGQARVAAALEAAGYRISAAGVRWIWQRHHLETAPKRAAALGRIDAKRLDAAQRQALARIRQRQGVRQRAARRGDLRERLLAVAVQEFEKHGFMRTSIRSVAHAAGVPTTTVYRLFASKDALFIATQAAGIQEMIRLMRTAIARSHDPWERLTIACTVHLRHLVSGNLLTAWTGASQFLFESVEMQRELRAERKRFEAIYQRLIDELPLVPGIDRSLLRLQLLGALNWTRIWYRADGKSVADIAGHLVRTLREPLERR